MRASLADRLTLEFVYESLYGGERFVPQTTPSANVTGTVAPVRHRLGPPSRVAELGFSRIRLILAKLTLGPAVMIDRPAPPAAPSPITLDDRPCHPKWLVRQRVCRCGVGTPKVRRQKT